MTAAAVVSYLIGAYGIGWATGVIFRSTTQFFERLF